ITAFVSRRPISSILVDSLRLDCRGAMVSQLFPADLPIMAFLSSVFVVVGICFGDMRPLITVVVFAGIFAAFYLYAKRPGTVIGYPDGPIWSFREARDEAAGARMIIIPRDRCQFKGCDG